MDLFENFSNNLKHYLFKMKISQKEFARRVGVSATCVTKWILKQHEPTLSNIVKIIHVLDISFDDLIAN